MDQTDLLKHQSESFFLYALCGTIYELNQLDEFFPILQAEQAGEQFDDDSDSQIDAIFDDFFSPYHVVNFIRCPERIEE